ncbi:MAG: hypothetical protein N2378_12630 [Chloroflexaceae bacterium]|nr:hypothetical protein [Chloroflexaceae bacterium]
MHRFLRTLGARRWPAQARHSRRAAALLPAALRSLILAPILAAALIGTALLSACSSQPSEPTAQATATPSAATSPAPAQGSPGPAADASATAPAYPGPADVAALPDTDGRSQTALESYKVALEYVRQQYPNVDFLGIVPSHIMLNNLGNPPVTLGWFFKFKSPDDPAFHFVQVVDGEITGMRSLTPLGEDETQLPIDMSKVTVDSPAVFERFRANAPAKGITVDDQVTYDLELVYLPGSPGPVWSVVTPDGSQWLYSVNAVTGEEAPIPRT